MGKEIYCCIASAMSYGVMSPGIAFVIVRAEKGRRRELW
jgi:hypothetical protein